ncbi:reverse transcriptase domain-containing protein [Tanacetum coccineum]
MHKGVKRFIRECDVYQRQKPDLCAYPGLLQPLPITGRVWSEISMNFIVGLPKSQGKSVIFVVVNRLSKYAHFMALSHPYIASSVAQVFVDTMYKLYGLPTYHPQTDGQTKVVNKCLECCLRTRMKVYANRKRSKREFEAGMWVYLKLQPHRQVIIMKEQQQKLLLKYYDPFMILAKDLVKEISTNIGREFTNLEILKCWSIETSRKRIFKKRAKRKPKASNSKHGVERGQMHAHSFPSSSSTIRQQLRQQQQVPLNLVEPPKDTMADNQTMAELLQAPTEGYEDAIVVPEIAAANFEIKHGLLTLVQNKQFFGHDKEDPHAHIRYFNKITSTLRYPNVPTTSIKLMLFPFSLEGAARIWLEKEPPRSIQTWDELVAKFINQFFLPSKMTNLRNEITNFKQRFDESFSEAWDRFKDLLRACPHHGFSELHQLDTFYNALNVNDQDSLNSAAGGNFLDKRPADCSSIIESKSKVRNSRSKAIVAKVSTSASTSGVSPDVAELKDMVRALLLDKQTSPVPAPAPVKAVEQSCVTCGGAHSYRNCPATDSNNYRDNIQEYVSQAATANFNQGNSGYRPLPIANQIRPPGFPPMHHNSQANNQNHWNQNQNQNRGNGYNQGQIQ